MSKLTATGSEVRAYDATLDILLADFEVPQKLRDLFGEQHIAKLQEFLQEEEFMDFDILMAAGDLNHDEVEQYASTLPPYQKAYRALYEVAMEMARDLTDKNRLERRLKKSIQTTTPQDGSPPIKTVRTDKGIVELFLQIDEFFLSLRPKIGRKTIRGGFLRILRRILHEQLYLATMQTIFESEELRSLREAFWQVLTSPAVSKVETRAQKPDIPAAYLLGDLQELGDFAKQYPSAFDDMGYAPTETTEIETLHAEVRELSFLRQVGPFEHRAGKFSITIKEAPHLYLNRALYLGEVGVKVQTKKGGSFNLNFLLMRQANQAFFKGIFIELADLIGQQNADKFKNWILRLIKQHLEAKPETFEDQRATDDLSDYYYQRPGPTAAEIQAETQTGTDEILPEVAEVADRQLPGIQAIRDATAEDAQNTHDPDRRKLRGLARGEVMRILNRILGNPIRITGSHYIYEGPTGTRLPIPLGSGGDVNRHILLKNLFGWGIYERFLSELS